jgi:8-oxo-dGTP pyrophosphatase MutT (NUDIX family)
MEGLYGMMNDNELKWNILESRELLHTPVYDVIGQKERSASGLEGEYMAIDAPGWVMVIPKYRDSFVLVRQWRHAYEGITAEFPGGVLDAGEDPAVAAERELLEETGFKVGKMTCLGAVSPNAALFKNRFHIYLAEDLTPTGEQDLDDDEFLSYLLAPVDEVIDSFGRGEYMHALMGTAIALYLSHERRKEQA